MAIIITTASILVITGLVWLLNKALPFKVCPICAGVSLTWVLLTAGVLTGKLLITNYYLLITMLMGGTVVGIAFQGEKRFKWAEENILRFKALVVVIGFILVYLALTNLSWVGLGIEIIILAALVYLFFVSQPREGNEKSDLRPREKVSELEEKMKECC